MTDLKAIYSDHKECKLVLANEGCNIFTSLYVICLDHDYLLATIDS